MTVQAPSFIDSKHLIIDEKGWRLKDDAPKELVKEFQEYMNMLKVDYQMFVATRYATNKRSCSNY